MIRDDRYNNLTMVSLLAWLILQNLQPSFLIHQPSVCRLVCWQAWGIRFLLEAEKCHIEHLHEESLKSGSHVCGTAVQPPQPIICCLLDLLLKFRVREPVSLKPIRSPSEAMGSTVLVWCLITYFLQGRGWV